MHIDGTLSDFSKAVAMLSAFDNEHVPTGSRHNQSGPCVLAVFRYVDMACLVTFVQTFQRGDGLIFRHVVRNRFLT